ncbi:MAG: hypothetical protein PHV49_03255 [Alistipes sp.]|nr:hypothetical protein [Alistipes sp.]
MELSETITSTVGLRTYLMDLGGGIAMFAALCLLACWIFKIQKAKDLKRIVTQGKAMQYLLANAATLCILPAMLWYYWMCGKRGDFGTSDAIIIPMMTQLVWIMIWLPLSNLFLFLSLRRSVLPASLLVRTTSSAVTLKGWNIVYALCLGIMLLLLLRSIVFGSLFEIPILMVFIYVLLSLRAGKIAYYTQKSATPKDTPLSVEG